MEENRTTAVINDATDTERSVDTAAASTAPDLTESTKNTVERTEHTDGEACTCKQCRVKSWAMWVSVLGLLGIILQHTGVFAKLGLDSETWDMIITLIGGVLTAFGIVNNPTEKKKL